MTLQLSALDRHFSPSAHAGGPRSPAEVIDGFVTFQLACLREQLDRTAHELDLAYCREPDEQQRFDAWFPAEEAERWKRVLVFLHGGYWQEGSRKTVCSVLPIFLAQGFTVVTLGYVLATRIPLPDLVGRVQDGVRELMNKHPKAEFAIAGHSAGAQLAAKVVQVPDLAHRLSSALLLAPVLDLKPLVDTYIGRGISLTPEAAEACSVDLDSLARYKGRLLLVSAGRDAPGLLEQAEAARERLQRDKQGNLFVQTFDEDHFSLLNALYEPGSAVSQWIQTSMSQ